MKRILGKVQEMREQRGSLEKQLRDLIQMDDITSTLVTTERADMKVCGFTFCSVPPPQHSKSILLSIQNVTSNNLYLPSVCLRSS